MGGELNEILLVLNTREALASLMGSTQVKLGLNLSVAMGPVGRQIEGTGVAGGRGSAACYAYAVSRGAFAGVALDGCRWSAAAVAAITARTAFHGKDHGPSWWRRANAGFERVADFDLSVAIFAAREAAVCDGSPVQRRSPATAATAGVSEEARGAVMMRWFGSGDDRLACL